MERKRKADFFLLFMFLISYMLSLDVSWYTVSYLAKYPNSIFKVLINIFGVSRPINDMSQRELNKFQAGLLLASFIVFALISILIYCKYLREIMERKELSFVEDYFIPACVAFGPVLIVVGLDYDLMRQWGAILGAALLAMGCLSLLQIVRSLKNKISFLEKKIEDFHLS